MVYTRITFLTWKYFLEILPIFSTGNLLNNFFGKKKKKLMKTDLMCLIDGASL